ncbi:MAG TPA: hypothetical protein V6C69_21090 [Trichormus sp.]|jgi:hypothetical protein
MNMKTLGRMVLAAVLTTSAVAPALALDYEAKPVMWVIQAPYRTVGAVTGAVFCGLVSGPIDGGYHGALKGDKHVAGKFGDENGAGQEVAAVPLGGGGGLIVGGAYGGYKGVGHGWKTGWDKPFSRWSYITMEEK